MFNVLSPRNLLGCCAAVAALSACGAQDASVPQTQNFDPIQAESDAGSENDPVSSSGDATRGAAIAQQQACGSCHLQDYSGTGFYANITQDEATGIGAWSDEEIADAVVHGVDPDGETLCVAMPRVALSEAEVADLVAYLRSVPPVRNEVDELCPGQGR